MTSTGRRCFDMQQPHASSPLHICSLLESCFCEFRIEVALQNDLLKLSRDTDGPAQRWLHKRWRPHFEAILQTGCDLEDCAVVPLNVYYKALHQVGVICRILVGNSTGEVNLPSLLAAAHTMQACKVCSFSPSQRQHGFPLLGKLQNPACESFEGVLEDLEFHGRYRLVPTALETREYLQQNRQLKVVEPEVYSVLLGVCLKPANWTGLEIQNYVVVACESVKLQKAKSRQGLKRGAAADAVTGHSAKEQRTS